LIAEALRANGKSCLYTCGLDAVDQCLSTFRGT